MLGDRGIIEAVEHPLEVIAALPESKCNAYDIVGLAARGIAGPGLRIHRAKACEQFAGKNSTTPS